MQIIPVMDVLGGIVVRAVAGNRDSYRPLRSRIADSPDPIQIAHAFRDQFGLTSLYVADLDAILHGNPNYVLYASLAAEGFHLMVDGGVRDAAGARMLLETGIESVVIGLETCDDPEVLDQIRCEIGAERLIFSLDLKLGKPLGDLTKWGTGDPLRIAERAVEAGVQRLIVLDLAQVGIGEGPATLELCKVLARRFPELRLITGGGIRGPGDLEPLRSLGIAGVLIASALHDGRLSRAHIGDCRSR